MERSGSVGNLVQRSPGGQRVASSSLTTSEVSVMFPCARHFICCIIGTGSTQEDLSRHDWKVVDWNVKNQTKKKKKKKKKRQTIKILSGYNIYVKIE